MSNNLEEIEAKLLTLADAVNDINEEMIRNYSGSGSRELNRAYTELVTARTVVMKEIVNRKRINRNFDK